MPKTELAAFLRDHRARLRAPSGSDHRPRRTPGLRREEVAMRACVSVDYYVRLEQARGPRPSPRVLEALSAALELNPAERQRLFTLAEALPIPPRTAPRTVRPHVAALLDRLSGTAAVVTTATYDVVAWNALAEALVPDFRAELNLARRSFLLGAPWVSGQDDFAEITVARLRNAATRYPHDPGLTQVLNDLHAGSGLFRDVWESNPARTPGHRRKTIDHPAVGRLTVTCDVLLVPEDDQQVVFLTADPGSRDQRALHLLERSAHPNAGTGPHPSNGSTAPVDPA